MLDGLGGRFATEAKLAIGDFERHGFRLDGLLVEWDRLLVER